MVRGKTDEIAREQVDFWHWQIASRVLRNVGEPHIVVFSKTIFI